MEGQGRSRKVKEGNGWSFPITRLTFQVRKVMGGWFVVVAVWPVGIKPQSQSLSSGLWILDLDFGLGFWTGLGLYNSLWLR